MKIIVTIIPTSLVISSLSFLFLSLHKNQKQKSVGGLVTRNTVKPPNSGHLRVLTKVSAIRRCPLHRGFSKNRLLAVIFNLTRYLKVLGVQGKERGYN